MTKHYPYSPSATARWFACPGSVELSEDQTNSESSYAAEGTLAHSVAEEMLTGKFDPDRIVPEGMSEHLGAYVEYCETLRQRDDCAGSNVERTIEHPDYPGQLGGTVDFSALTVSDKTTLHIVDLKYGTGIAVSAIENKQLLTYAEILHAFYGLLQIDEFHLSIFQPRAQNGDTETHWVCTPDRLLAHILEIQQAMQQDHRTPGDHCRWCPALTICPEFQAESERISLEMFDEPPVDNSELQQWLRWYSMAPAVKAKLELVKQRLLETHDAGTPLPGYSVVSKPNRRVWDKEQDVYKILTRKFGKRKVTESVLLTPARLETEVPETEETIKDLVTQSISRQIVSNPCRF